MASASAAGATSSAAVAFLRRRTLLRSLRAYARWVGRAVGWWTVAYLVFWLVAFVVSGVQLALVPAQEPLPDALAAVASLVVAAWLALPPRVRVPPVHLDRRDLVRLALAPVPPRDALGYRLLMRRASLALGAGLLGVAWSLFARSYMHLGAPWAALTLAALAVARLELAWLRYAGSAVEAVAGVAAGRVGVVLTLLGACSAASPALALLLGAERAWAAAVTAGLVGGGPAAAAAPLALLACGWLAARRSRAESWPPRFAPQSHVLTQLGSLRSLQVISEAAGLDLGAGAVGAERERLLAALHDRPGSLRPSRSLRRPGPGRPAWLALAWRAASTVYRRPLAQWVRLALQSAAAAAAGIVVSASLGSGGSGPMPRGLLGAGAGPLGGAVAVLVAGFLLAQAFASLLGPAPPARLVPLAPAARTWGRLSPALLVVASFSVLAGLALSASGFAGTTGTATAAAGFVALALTAALALEKYSAWTGLSPTRFEPQAVAAVLVALPALLLEAFGYPAWTLVAQWALLAVVLVVDV